MTSRAFRKLERIAQAETTEDPAQKEDADADLSGQEEESELPQRGNVFAALLAEDGLDEDEDEEDKGSDKEDNAPQRKIPATPPQSGAGKKKRGKKKGPSRTDDTSESVKIDDDEDIDAILAELRLKEEAGEKDVKGKKKDLGGKGKSPVSAAYRLLSVDPKNLDADAEMKRMFGAIVLQQEQAPAAGRGRGGRSTAKVNKRTLLAAHKDTWPRMTKLGLDMQSLGQDSQGCNLFTFTHSKFYSDVQIQFLMAINTHDPQALSNLLHMFPYHIDSLLQLSEVYKASGNAASAADFIERALYSFERALHPMFNLSTGTSRLEFNRVENRSFFLALFRHCDVVMRKGCWRTAFEVQKLLLSLDFQNDPYGTLLTIDYFALKSLQYQWIVDFWTAFKTEKQLESYPNWTYSVALANWELEEIKKEGHENSSSMLSAAIRMYPCAVPLIYDKAALNDPQMSSNAFFKPPPVGSPLEIRVQVFVEKHHSLWKMSDALSWLRSQVSKVIALPHISNAPELSKWPQKLESSTVSMSVVRHIVVSDMASLLGCIRTLAPYQVLAYDPVPPATATRSVYDDFLEAQQSQNPLSNASILSALVQSLLPWQGPEGLPDAGFNAHRLEQRQVDEALNVAENAVPELFAPGQEAAGASWLQSLRGALNGLLGQTDDVSDDDEEDEIFVDAQEGPAEQ